MIGKGAIGQNAALPWRFGAVVALVLATSTPSWPEDGTQDALTRALQDAGSMPAYHLAVGKLDGGLGRADSRIGDLAAGPFAQAGGVSGAAGARPVEPEPHEESASELNRKLTNPVSTLWSLSNQFNNYKLENGHWNNNWNFQPVMPVALTKDLNLITRPVMPLYNIVPHQTGPGEFERTVGLGDLALLELLSPANTGHWVLGGGPTFIFPTATSKFTGQGKVQAGPGVVVGYLTKEFFVGLFPQQWFSIGGDSSRPDTSQMNLEPIAAFFFGDGWSVYYSGNILADWKAPSGDIWTVPVGLGVGKVVKLGRLPVKLGLSLQYMPVHPQNVGQQWNVQVEVTPVLPKLIKGILFE